jgi:hypothetical protein
MTVFALTLISILVLYTFVALLTIRLYLHLPLYILIIVATILAVFLALLCFRLRRSIQVFVDRIFYRETYHYRHTLFNFTLKMGNILNLDHLAWETLQTLSKAIRISPAILLLEDGDSSSFTTKFVYPKLQDKPDNELRLALDSGLVARLRKESHPISVQRIESIVEVKGISPVERDVLGNLELLCPIKSLGKLVGILGLGKKQSNNHYSQDDLQLVTDTTNQAGVILENAILFHDIIRDANELKAANKKLTEVEKLKTDSLSKEFAELQSPLITINNEVESMLSGKYGLITTALQTQLQTLLDRVNEERKLVETMQIRL